MENKPKDLPFNFSLDSGHSSSIRGANAKTDIFKTMNDHAAMLDLEKNIRQQFEESTGMKPETLSAREPSLPTYFSTAESVVKAMGEQAAHHIDQSVLDELARVSSEKATRKILHLTDLSPESLEQLNFKLVNYMRNIALRFRREGYDSIPYEDFKMFQEFMQICKDMPVDTLLTFALNNAGRVPTEGAIVRMIEYMHQMTVPNIPVSEDNAPDVNNPDIKQAINDFIFNVSNHKLVKRCRTLEVNYPDTISLSITLSNEEARDEEEGEVFMEILYNYIAEQKEALKVTEIEIIFSNKVVF